MSKTKATTNKDFKRAQALMTTYAIIEGNLAALKERIKNEVDAYTRNKKETEEELLEIGARLRDQFDIQGNLQLEDGYIHVATNTVIQYAKKFDPMAFAKAFPDMIDMQKALKVAPIKKAFLDEDQRKELKAFGVSTTTEEALQVLLNKK